MSVAGEDACNTMARDRTCRSNERNIKSEKDLTGIQNPASMQAIGPDWFYYT